MTTPHRSTARGWFLSRFGGSAATAGLLAPLRARAQTASPLPPLRIGIAPSDGVTAVVYAAKAGLFAKAGLDVTLETQNNGAAVAEAVLSGVFGVGNSSLTSILIGHERGLPFVLVAGAGLYDARNLTTGALLLKESPLTLGKDADDSTIGLASLSGTGHDAFCAWVDQHGGDSSTLKFVEIPFSATGPALLAHRVVATETTVPSMTYYLDSGNFRIIPIYNAIGSLFLVSAWFTSKDFLAKNPETVRRFARVVAESARYANAHPSATAPVMASFIGIPLETLEHMPRTPLGPTLEPNLIQPAIAAAAKYGTLKRAFPAQELLG